MEPLCGKRPRLPLAPACALCYRAAMLIVRLEASGQVCYGRLLLDRPDEVELLTGSPLDPGGALPGGTCVPFDPACLLCPVQPGKIVAVGSNYREHIREMGKQPPEEPVIFLKPPSALLRPGGAIVRPLGYDRVDYEGEVA